MDKVDLWWSTMQGWQQELGFDWKRFKELFEDHFYLVSLQKAKQNEFMHL